MYKLYERKDNKSKVIATIECDNIGTAGQFFDPIVENKKKFGSESIFAIKKQEGSSGMYILTVKGETRHSGHFSNSPEVFNTEEEAQKDFNAEVLESLNGDFFRGEFTVHNSDRTFFSGDDDNGTWIEIRIIEKKLKFDF